ncbi:hypothetical protein ACQV2W_08280, partial [Facklamia sp. P12934]
MKKLKRLTERLNRKLLPERMNAKRTPSSQKYHRKIARILFLVKKNTPLIKRYLTVVIAFLRPMSSGYLWPIIYVNTQSSEGLYHKSIFAITFKIRPEI